MSTDVMSLACEQTAEMMRATASFHGDDAGWELGNQTDQRFSLRSPAQNDRARCVETDDTANILAEIDAEHGNLHDSSLQLSLRRTYNAGRRGGPFHKTVIASERDRPDIARRRAQWMEHQNRIKPERLVFIDETWTKTNMAPLRGWAPRGARLKAKVPHGHWKTLTFVAALRHDRIEAPFVLDGPINGECF